MDHPKKSNSKKLADSKPKSGVQHRRADSFTSKYSNNIQMETSTWDMKLIFGELDQSLGPQLVVQHTAITIPWTYVKILGYLLQLHLVQHENTNGRVLVPKGIITPIPTGKPKELDNVSDENFAVARKLYEEFISANPEAVPEISSKS